MEHLPRVGSMRISISYLSECRNLPPLLGEVKSDEVSIWGFSWLPEISEFGADGLKDGKT